MGSKDEKKREVNFEGSMSLAEVLVYNAGDDPQNSAALLRLRSSQLGFRTGSAYSVLITGDLNGIDAVIAQVR